MKDFCKDPHVDDLILHTFCGNENYKQQSQNENF